MKLSLNTVSVRLLWTLAVFVFSALFFAAGIGNRAIVTKGEGREALVAAEMLRTQNYILPLRHNEIPSKPPMFQWAASLTADLRGTLDESTVRLPSVIAAGLATAAAFLFFASQCGLQPAALIVAVLISMFEWMRSAGHARVDMCFAFFLSIAFYLSFLWFERGAKKKSLSVMLLPIFLGLALTGSILSKGPAGLLVLSATVFLYAFSLRNHQTSTFQLLLGYGAACILAILLAGIWYGQAYLLGKDAFVAVHFWRENVARIIEVPGTNVGHEKPFYFGLIHFIVSLLPWSIVLPLVGAFLYYHRQHLRDPRERLLLFALLWILFFLTAVTLSSSKRVVYFLPALPACAYIIVRALEFVCARARQNHDTSILTGIRLSAATFMLAAFIVSLSTVLILNSKFLLSGAQTGAQLRILQSGFEHPAAPLLLLCASIIMAGAAKSLRHFQAGRFISGAAFAAALSAGAINVFILPAFAEAQSVHLLGRAISELTRDRRVFKLGERSYPLLFYAERDIEPIEGLPVLPPEEEWFIVAPALEVPELIRHSPRLASAYSCNPPKGCGEENLVLLRYPGAGT